MDRQRPEEIRDAIYQAFYTNGLQFVGLSTDTKPTTFVDSSALPDGASFYEKDTGATWDWDADEDAMCWVKRDPSEDPTADEEKEDEHRTRVLDLHQETNILLRGILAGIARLTGCEVDELTGQPDLEAAASSTFPE